MTGLFYRVSCPQGSSVLSVFTFSTRNLRLRIVCSTIRQVWLARFTGTREFGSIDRPGQGAIRGASDSVLKKADEVGRASWHLITVAKPMWSARAGGNGVWTWMECLLFCTLDIFYINLFSLPSIILPTHHTKGIFSALILLKSLMPNVKILHRLRTRHSI